MLLTKRSRATIIQYNNKIFVVGKDALVSPRRLFLFHLYPYCVSAGDGGNANPSPSQKVQKILHEKIKTGT